MKKNTADLHADFYELDANGRTALHYAAERGDLKEVRVLVEAGAFVNLLNNDWKTPLDLATDPMVRAFLKRHRQRRSP